MGQGPWRLLDGALALGLQPSMRPGQPLASRSGCCRVWSSPCDRDVPPTWVPHASPHRVPCGCREGPSLPLLRQEASSLGDGYSQVWETHLAPHSLKGKKKGEGHWGCRVPVETTGPGPCPCGPGCPHPQQRPLPAAQKPLESSVSRPYCVLWDSEHPGGAVLGWGHPTPGAPPPALKLRSGQPRVCLPHSRTQTFVCVLKRVCPSGQKQPSASPSLPVLWLLQGQEGVPWTLDPHERSPEGRAGGMVEGWGLPAAQGHSGVEGQRSGKGSPRPFSAPQTFQAGVTWSHRTWAVRGHMAGTPCRRDR